MTSTAGRTKLSQVQLADLRKLSDPADYIRTRGITNATMSALERRGFAEVRPMQSEHVENHTVFRWFITDAGRAALAAAKTGSAP